MATNKNSEKQFYIDEINNFINSVPNLNPDGSHLYKARTQMINFANNNNYQILDYTLFTTKRYDFIKGYNEYDFAIVRNKTTNVKSILIKRGSYSPITEISVRLCVNTLKGLHQMLVTDVGNHSIMLREKKEKVSSLIDLLNSNKIFVTSNRSYITIYSNCKYTVQTHPLKISGNEDIHVVSFEEVSNSYHNRQSFMLTNVKQIDDFINSRNLFFNTIEEAKEYVAAKFDEFIDGKLSVLKYKKEETLAFVNRIA